MKYEEPNIQIVIINNEDLVRTSSVKPGNPLEDENYGKFPTQ